MERHLASQFNLTAEKDDRMKEKRAKLEQL